MTRRFGDRASFAVEVGRFASARLRVVDLWAAGRHLTTDDNTAYLPSFRPMMRATADAVRRREIEPCPFPGRSPEKNFRLLERDRTGFSERHWFMRWGETVDNVRTFAYLEDGDLVVTFAFWRPSHPRPEELGRVFVARVSPDDFAATLSAAADLLEETPRTPTGSDVSPHRTT